MTARNAYERHGDRLLVAAQVGRLRRAMEMQLSFVVDADRLVRLVDFNAVATDVAYVAVQAAPGMPAPVVARFSGHGGAGAASAYHNFAVEPLFEQVLTSGDSLYVLTDLTTQLLVQVVSL